MPLKLPPREFTGTSVRFFAILNAVKLIPYFALGQLDTKNLVTSMTLLPFAPLATIAGAWCVRRMKPEIFYPVRWKDARSVYEPAEVVEAMLTPETRAVHLWHSRLHGLRDNPPAPGSYIDLACKRFGIDPTI